MITEIEDYFRKGCGRCPRFDTPDCATRRWHAGLLRLRALCLGAGLAETVKWGHPCYVHAGRNIAILGALRDDFRLSFFDAALLTDPDGVLERPGPNSRHPDTIRFAGDAAVGELAPVIRAYLVEAMSLAERGLRPARERAEPELPAELAAALAADPELAAAFGALTPGRRRSYVVALSTARRPDTRARRVAGFRSRILAGRGATER